MSDSPNRELDDQQRLAEDARRLLDEKANQLDETTLAGLRAARLRALDAMPRRGQAWQWMGGLAMAAGVAVLAVLVTFDRETLTETDLEVLAVAMTDEDVEFYEDLDFVLWLEEQEILIESHGRQG